MKRSGENIFNRLGRKPLRTHSVTPEIYVRPIWLDDEQSNVEIIELNSSSEFVISPRNTNTKNDAIQQAVDSYNINRKTREKRWNQNMQNHLTDFTSIGTVVADDYNRNSTNNFNTNLTNSQTDDNLASNYQNNVNYFTLLNNHFIGSDTSTDGDYGDVEVITSHDFIIDNGKCDTQNNNFYNNDIITYDADLDSETQTIWIYSYKNKLLSPDDELESNNSSKKGISTSSESYSTDSSGEHAQDKTVKFSRLGSPIPLNYIPKLDLSMVPTLSTVTEISERNMRTTPTESITSSNNKSRKPANNWIEPESEKSFRTHKKLVNLINWMGLSPRVPRRRINDRTLSDTLAGFRLECKEYCLNCNMKRDENQSKKMKPNDKVQVQVDIEVHVDVTKENESDIHDSDVFIKSNIYNLSSINKIEYADASLKYFANDPGEPNAKLVIVRIKCPSPNISKRPEMPDLFEELENSNQSHESRQSKEIGVNKVLHKSVSTLDVENTSNTVNTIRSKNTDPFIKPSRWTDSIPTAESRVSFHLSLGSIVERRTWIKRALDFLNCCK